ncbi:Pentatricopeptide repeat-containing protein [Melia azedarach]|uniref:Pentatricopeptide repeat-containing protein n=1 Tax=Melia azedarach TaxID=155640 RepID=A0ACC1XF26_MELAZ|nr:Pentatricopeptide repeat-containing protein [Melia azedarach]
MDYSGMQHGESLNACVIKYGLQNQPSVLTALSSMYSKLGNVSSAKFLFDQIPNKNILSWNSMISGYVDNALQKAGLAVFCQMQFAGVNLDAISVISILLACSKLETVLLGKSAHAFSLRKGLISNLDIVNVLLMFYSDCCKPSYSFNIFHRISTGSYAIKSGYVSDVTLMNALITMSRDCGSLNDGRLLFDVMHVRSLVSWNALITGYRYQNLQNEMQLSGVSLSPSEITYSSVLSACSHADSVEQSQMVFKSMLERGISPKMNTAFMVELLARTGYLTGAFNFVMKLPFKPSISLLESLLGDCRIHDSVVTW